VDSSIRLVYYAIDPIPRDGFSPAACSVSVSHLFRRVSVKPKRKIN